VRRIVTILAVLAVAALLLSGCGQEQSTIEKGKLLVGAYMDAGAPLSVMEGGKPVGYSVDLCNEIAERMGLECEIVPTPVGDLIDGLNSEKFDIIGSVMKMTPERIQEIDFSIPYLEVSDEIFVLKGSAIRSEADLAGKVVGTLAGTATAKELEELENLKDVKLFETDLLGLEALEKGEIDAYIGYRHSTWDNIKKTGKEAEMVTEFGATVDLGIGVKKGNTELLNNVNKALEEMQKDGTLENLEKEWLE
jgi:ABC-type amino acid transport substrate-binding protein